MKMRIVKCDICGKLFRTNAPNAKYCSLRCRFKGMEQRREVWKGNNPEYYRKYAAEHR